MSSIFNSQNVITEHISNADLRTYFVGFDFGQYRYDRLTEYILDALVDFSYGYHTGILKSYDRKIIIEAAKSIYNISTDSGIKIFEEAKKTYMDGDSEYSDDIEEKYLKRGEFGELILHLMLRDFMQTIPLVSKIHFKDSDGMTVHGFDAVHIGNCPQNISKKSLFLGESKLYQDGKRGVGDLVKDIEEHFKSDFLNREFILIGKKSDSYKNIDDYFDKNTIDEYKEFLKEKDYWFQELDKVQTGQSKMQDLFNSITIPLLCTYNSKVFGEYTDENTNDFKLAHEKEVKEIKEYFDKHLKTLKDNTESSGSPISTNLNIILMLFPVPSKKELVKRIHEKLYFQQKA